MKGSKDIEFAAKQGDAQCMEKYEDFEEHSNAPKAPKKHAHKHKRRKHSRTQSLDDSLVEEEQRNRPSDSASNVSLHSSSISEIVFKSPKFRTMLQSKEYHIPRRKQAVEKSVTKVATWLVESDNNDVESAELHRTESSECNDTVKSSLSNVASESGDHADKAYSVIDVVNGNVIYFDSDPSEASHSGGLLKESCLLSCKVVISHVITKDEMFSKGCNMSGAITSQYSAPTTKMNRQGNQALVVSGHQGASDCGYIRNGI